MSPELHTTARIIGLPSLVWYRSKTENYLTSRAASSSVQKTPTPSSAATPIGRTGQCELFYCFRPSFVRLERPVFCVTQQMKRAYMRKRAIGCLATNSVAFVSQTRRKKLRDSELCLLRHVVADCHCVTPLWLPCYAEGRRLSGVGGSVYGYRQQCT